MKPSIAADHPLIGTWIADEEDSNVAFTFSVKNDAFHVSGFCRSDGEKFEVSQVKWDGKALSFIARMPSTDTVTNNVFRLRPDSRFNNHFNAPIFLIPKGLVSSGSILQADLMSDYK
jgi:hypothetical protein